jgi:thiol-disulfide isomerase/thioredoxin
MPAAKRKTQKGKRKAQKPSSSVLDVRSPSQAKALEKMLKDGKITIVLIYADWCGACHRFRKNVWGPMCKKGALHNRAAIEESQLNNTPLGDKVNIEHFPSVIVVNEKGEVEDIPKPDGTMTNAIPTPKTVEEMERIVNAPVAPLAASGAPLAAPGAPLATSGAPLAASGAPLAAPGASGAPVEKPLPINSFKTPTLEPLTPNIRQTNTLPPNKGTPEGITYIPTPETVPPVKQAGGGCGCGFSGTEIPGLFVGGGALLKRLEQYVIKGRSTGRTRKGRDGRKVQKSTRKTRGQRKN